MKKLSFLFFFFLFAKSISAGVEVTDSIVKEVFYERIQLGDIKTLDRLDSLLQETTSYELQAKIHTFKIAILAKSPGKYEELIQSYLDLSLMSIYNSNSYLAIQSALKAKEIAIKYKDKEKLAKCDFRLGTAYQFYSNCHMGFVELNNATKYFETQPVKYYKDLSKCYGFLMAHYNNLNNSDSVEYFFNKGFNLCNSQKDTLNALNILIPYVSSLIDENKFFKRIDFYLAKVDSLSVNNKDFITTIFKKNVGIKYKIKVQNSLKNVLPEINILKQKTEENSFVKTLILETEELYYQEKGDFEKFLFIKNKRDSLNEEIRKNKITSLHIELNQEIDEIEKELLLVESKQELLKSKNRLITYVVFFLIILSAFLIILIVLIRRNRKAKRIILEEELNKRNRDLASKSLLLNEKQKILDQFIAVKNAKNNLEEISGIIKSISTNVVHYQEDFMKHFNEVHPGFYTKLSEKHPDLSSNELKICGYYKMKLTTKEISQILNINPESVQKSRYRIRKKMMLRKDTSLDQYIHSI